MNARTEAELLAYVAGYDACYKQFLEYLRTKQFEKAMTAMACIHSMVSATVEQKGEPMSDLISRQAAIDDEKD